MALTKASNISLNIAHALVNLKLAYSFVRHGECSFNGGLTSFAFALAFVLFLLLSMK